MKRKSTLQKRLGRKNYTLIGKDLCNERKFMYFCAIWKWTIIYHEVWFNLQLVYTLRNTFEKTNVVKLQFIWIRCHIYFVQFPSLCHWQCWAKRSHFVNVTEGSCHLETKFTLWYSTLLLLCTISLLYTWASCKFGWSSTQGTQCQEKWPYVRKEANLGMGDILDILDIRHSVK